MSRFCREHDVSTSWFYEVRARARAEGPLAALSDRSRRPERSPRAVRPEIEDLAVRMRKQLADDGWDCGPLSVRQRMLADGLPAPSRATLARIFTRRGMVVPAPSKRPRSSWRRFSFAAPNECWQLDATEWTLLDGTVVVALQVIDDHSRMLLASRAAVSENADDALTVVDTAIKRWGVPQRLLSDNSLAFNPIRRRRTCLLTTRLRLLGVQPIASSPYHPQTCGKNERAHSTLKQWLRARPPAASLAEFQAQLDTFDELYNTRRPHQALDGRTPAQAWRATPVADPPAPDDANPSPPRTATAAQVRHRTVNATGELNAFKTVICLGVFYAGITITVIQDDSTDQLHLYDSAGQHLRTITRQPGRRYYGSDEPRTGRRKPRLQPSAMS